MTLLEAVRCKQCSYDVG